MQQVICIKNCFLELFEPDSVLMIVVLLLRYILEYSFDCGNSCPDLFKVIFNIPERSNLFKSSRAQIFNYGPSNAREDCFIHLLVHEFLHYKQFKKFMKNANGKGFDKDSRQSSSSQFKSQDKGKKDAKDGATVNPTEGVVEDVVEEEELAESKFEKMNEQDDIHTAYEKQYKLFEKHEKLYRLATKKLSDVELDLSILPPNHQFKGLIKGNVLSSFSTPDGSIEKVPRLSIASGSIELQFLHLVVCSSTHAQHLHLSTAKISTPPSTHGSTPLDTFICRDLLSREWESLCDIPVTCPSVLIHEFYPNMHGIDHSVAHFFTHVRGTRFPVTPQLVADVLRVPRVKFPDYPSCERLRTVSKDELMTVFCERPSNWGDHVYQDSASRDKLIFPSSITRILRHFSIPFPVSDHFSCMCAIDTATVKCSEAQFRSRQSDSAAPPSLSTPSRSTPSTSTPSSSMGDVTLGDIMAQLQRMDARLDTLFTELYQVNVRVSRIARRQASMGGFASEASPPPPLVAFESEVEDDDDDGDDDDGDASSTDEMST
ncbi:hypothetical protein SO802_014078 [Lithocarpus litseifolius]|uniref:Uncharacterized protein n=1 Tax=Lithocarpus litseifolius TaxID=425828 RepID=A0AAW2D7D1_9ROSI